MAASTVIFDRVWKKFRRGERHDSLRDVIPAAFRRLTGRTRREELREGVEFWALEDVSFELTRGDALGIIGPNGAGKSTTLRLLTKLLRPTRGHCAVTGRVGALIEVAAGFHPDLTGRENVYLQGAIMGMRRADIATRFDAIVAFAGVEKFVDTPVKRYSSGMNARLGFAIAAHLEPDVLIIDEVLSVGDVGFQQRCTERMKEFRRQGVAIVFVSHNLQAVSELCDRSLLLRRRAIAMGPTSDVIAQYVRSENVAGAPAHDGFHIVEAALTGVDGRPLTQAVAGERARLVVKYQIAGPAEDVEFGVCLYRSTDGLEVYHANFTAAELQIPGGTSSGTFEVAHDFTMNVTRGQYHFAAHVFHLATHEYYARLSPAAVIAITETRTRAGVANLAMTARVVSARSSLSAGACDPVRC